MTRAEILHLAAQHSFLDQDRLENLWDRVTEVAHLGLPVIECGCGPGGSTAVLAGAMHAAGHRGRLIVCDTFAGLPPPDVALDRAEGWTEQQIMAATGTAAGTSDEIRRLCRLTGPSVGVMAVQGLYADTLAQLPDLAYSLLHADADWYYSTASILRYLGDRVAAGGVVIVDDYHFWAGCKHAVDEWLRNRLPNPLLYGRSCAAWWRVP